LESYYCILRWIKRIGGSYSLKKIFFKKFEWGTSTLENPEIAGKTQKSWFYPKILIPDNILPSTTKPVKYIGKFDFEKIIPLDANIFKNIPENVNFFRVVKTQKFGFQEKNTKSHYG
jgi:hypothetical protein